MKKILIMMLLLMPIAFAEQIVVNSQEWTDVYSGMIYANLIDERGSYIIDEGHAILLLNELSNEETTIIESVDSPFIRNYQANVAAKGITATTRFAEENLNLELAVESEAKGYLIVDSRYSYNAVSVAPYAVKKKYYVIFASEENIDEVIDIVDGSELIIYGYVDRAVSLALQEFGPTIINKGDKFSNNLEILKLYYDEFGSRQVVLTNGQFLEPQFFIGINPILFIGQNNVPEQTIDYLSQSEIKHGVLIGYDLFDNAVTLKSKAGMRIIVKFAKGIDSKQYALDLYALPIPSYSMGISSVDYNTISKKLEVSYYNTGDAPIFMKSSHNILQGNNSLQVVGDDSVIFISNSDTYTATYDVDLAGKDNLIVRSNILYGEDRGALEFLSIADNKVNFITFEDNSDVEILDVIYDRSTKRFNVDIRNVGTTAVYVKPLLIDVIVNNREETLTTDTIHLDEGKKQRFKIKARLTPEDIEDNEQLKVGVRYGRRNSSLTGYKEDTFEFKAKLLSGTMLLVTVVSVAIIVILIITIALFYLIPRKKRRHRLPPAPPPK